MRIYVTDVIFILKLQITSQINVGWICNNGIIEIFLISYNHPKRSNENKSFIKYMVQLEIFKPKHNIVILSNKWIKKYKNVCK